MEDVISYYYRGGSTFDSEIWRAAAASAGERLARRTQFSEYLAKLTELKRRGVMHGAPPYAFSPHTWQIVDEQMGYHSFDSAAPAPAEDAHAQAHEHAHEHGHAHDRGH